MKDTNTAFSQTVFIVLLAQGIGSVASLALTNDFDPWLAPPFVEYTPWLHLALTLVWLPVLIGCAIVSRPGWREGLGLLLVSGLLTGCYLSFLIPQFAQLLSVESSQCQQIILPNTQVCYSCPSQNLMGGNHSGHKEMRGRSASSVFVHPIREGEEQCTTATPENTNFFGDGNNYNINYVGKGNNVVSFTSSGEGLTHFRLDHGGDGDFIVKLLDNEGNLVSYLAYTIGPSKVEIPQQLEAGVYVIEITANGEWAIVALPPQ